MYLILKRLCDFLVSGFCLLLLSPLLIPIIIGLRLTGEGEIWYKQERVGYKNKKFLIWKFATMLKNSSKMDGGIMTVKKDPRITPMGHFLRASKINELPQLINIFKGDMSIVGPRPVMQISFEVYPKDIQATIYDVKPGLTGIGSIVFRDEEEIITKVKDSGEDPWKYYSEVIYPFKGDLEEWYQKNQNFLTDLKLIIVTVIIVLKPKTTIVHKWFQNLPKRILSS